MAFRRRPGGLPYPRFGGRPPSGDPAPAETRKRAPLVSCAQPKAEVRCDQQPYMLALLATAAVAGLPPGQQVSASAPAVARIGAPDVIPNLVLGLGPAPPGAQLSASAGVSTPSLPRIDVSNTLPLQVVVTLPAVQRLDAGSPAGASRLATPDPANTLPLAAVAVVNPPAVQLAAGAPQSRQAPSIDLAPNLVLGFGPAPPGGRLDSSAPASAVRLSGAEAANTLPLLPPTAPFPPGQQLVQNAPPPKPEVRAENGPAPLALGINPAPQAGRLDQSSPPPQAPVVVDVYPNLSTTTLYVPPPALLPPLGLPVDVAQFMPKFAVQVDLYPNTVLLGIPLPPAPPTSSLGSNSPSGGGGGGKRDWPEIPRHQKKATVPAADLLGSQAEERPGVDAAPAVARIEIDQAAASRLLAALAHPAKGGPDDDDDDEEAIYLLLS